MRLDELMGIIENERHVVVRNLDGIGGARFLMSDECDWKVADIWTELFPDMYEVRYIDICGETLFIDVYEIRE